MNDHPTSEKMTGAQFAGLRHQLQLTQAQLGKIMGMRPQEISRVESKTGPTKQQEAFIRYIERHHVAE